MKLDHVPAALHRELIVCLCSKTLQSVLRIRHAGNVRALVLQQDLAVGPAFAFLADEVLNRNFDIVEMNLVDLVFAVEQYDRFDALRRADSCRPERS